MKYHKTRDILHAKKSSAANPSATPCSTRNWSHSKATTSPHESHISEREACQLIETGFDFVCDYNGNKIFRKRK